MSVRSMPSIRKTLMLDALASAESGPVRVDAATVQSSPHAAMVNKSATKTQSRDGEELWDTSAGPACSASFEPLIGLPLCVPTIALTGLAHFTANVLAWVLYCEREWATSSIGRAPRSQCGGCGFKSHVVHHSLPDLRTLSRVQVKSAFWSPRVVGLV